MRINTNIASLNAQANNTNTNNKLASSLEKLSSGLQINKAADDASGMAIADKLRTQASSLGQGIQNANSGSALIQIADKAMSEQSNILDIVKTKLIQASTSTTSAEGREAVRKDIEKLLEQMDNISEQTNYNGINLLNEKGAELSFQVGEDADFDIGLTTAFAVNTTGLGAGDVNLNDEDSLHNLVGGVSLSGVDSQITVQYDPTEALAATAKKAVVIGEHNSLSGSGIVTLEVAGEDISGIGFNAGGTLNLTLKTDDAALNSALTDYASANAANLVNNGDGTFDVVNGQEFVVAFGSDIDISKLEVSGFETGEAAGDIMTVVSDNEVSITKTSGSAGVSLDSGAWTFADATTMATGDGQGATNLVGVQSTTAEGIAYTSANGVLLEQGTVGVQFDGESGGPVALSQTAQAAVLIEKNSTTADEATFTLNAEDVTTMTLAVSAVGTSALTLSTGSADTMATLDDLAANSSSLTKIGTGTYSFEATSTAAALSYASLDFGGADIKDLKISGMTQAEDVALVTEGQILVTKEDSIDDEDVKLTSITLDADTLGQTAAGSLSGAVGDAIQSSDTLAGLKSLQSGELTAETANKYMEVIDTAMTQLNSVRSDFGSTQGQLEVATRNMMVTKVNIQAAESVIRDTDYAAESASFNKQNIIAQAGTYAMSQANSMQQNVMRLLQ